MVEEVNQNQISNNKQAGSLTSSASGFFLRNCKLPSILCFSTVLCYYGGKLEMKCLVYSLAKGGAAFFNEKIKNGRFFKQNVLDKNLLNLNASIVQKHEESLNYWKANPVSLGLATESDG